MFYRHLFRPLLFALSSRDPERAHEWALRTLRVVGRWPVLRNVCGLLTDVGDRQLEQTVFGLRFRNPVGLAGGFDKNAVALHGLFALGFGFLEVGTVTSHPQVGNARPRMFRFPRDGALINRMGFNNDGAEVVAARLANIRQAEPFPIPIGVSLGKSRVTPLEGAVGDYRTSLRLLGPHADYLVVNVSSPNTPGLRELQEKAHLQVLLPVLIAEAAGCVPLGKSRPPVLVKIAPDLTEPAIDQLLQVCTDCGVDGLIATNTTICRDGLLTRTAETGGLSGRPLFSRALAVIQFVFRQTLGKLPIIGVGGIMGADDAVAMIRAGATLLQVYTGLVYEGPFFVRSLNRGLVRAMDRLGVKQLADLRGTS